VSVRREVHWSYHFDNFPSESELAAHARVLGFDEFEFFRRSCEVETVLRIQGHFIGQGTVVGRREDRVKFRGMNPSVGEVVVQERVLAFG
jgi:hypothetical protein